MIEISIKEGAVNDPIISKTMYTKIRIRLNLSNCNHSDRLSVTQEGKLLLTANTYISGIDSEQIIKEMVL